MRVAVLGLGEAGGRYVADLAWVIGDLVVLDADGAVVVAAGSVAAVLAAARTRIEREAALRERLRAGELSYEIYGLRVQDGR